ncbi:MAG TPA: hypothetical protein VKX49_13195 [Bryobacteraceae bacterium]|nr:hypothetical protein [Bryobacteraceae bacterium]
MAHKTGSLPEMRRSWNLPIWIGFTIVLVALVSYIPIFVKYAATRDVPWVNYLLFAVGLAVLGIGLRRAYRDPQHYVGKTSGTILGALAVLLAGLFALGTVYLTKQIPSAELALHNGQRAPAFNLQTADGKSVALADLLNNHRGAVLIFYRGYW